MKFWAKGTRVRYIGPMEDRFGTAPHQEARELGTTTGVTLEPEGYTLARMFQVAWDGGARNHAFGSELELAPAPEPPTGGS